MLIISRIIIRKNQERSLVTMFLGMTILVGWSVTAAAGGGVEDVEKARGAWPG